MGARFPTPVQTGPGTHPASCTMGNGSFLGVKSGRGRNADPSPPSSAVGHERVELYLYSPYGPYGLYRASVLVQGCMNLATCCHLKTILGLRGATLHCVMCRRCVMLNPLNAELNPICYLLALLGAHHFLHVSRIRVKSLILRLLMSYIYGGPILDVSRSHTTTQHSP